MFRDLRGLRKLMIAVQKTDTEEELAYETPMRFAGARELGNEPDESTDTGFYDNMPAIATEGEGADEYSLITSVLEEMVRATIEGRKYDEEKGAFFGGIKKKPYVAIGFIGEDTNGQEWYYWVYKGKLSGGSEKYVTKDNGTETTNLEWKYTSIYTTHKFTSNDNEPLKFYKLKAGGTVTEEKFFEKVYNPDEETAGA